MCSTRMKNIPLMSHIAVVWIPRSSLHYQVRSLKFAPIAPLVNPLYALGVWRGRYPLRHYTFPAAVRFSNVQSVVFTRNSSSPSYRVRGFSALRISMFLGFFPYRAAWGGLDEVLERENTDGLARRSPPGRAKSKDLGPPASSHLIVVLGSSSLLGWSQREHSNGPLPSNAPLPLDAYHDDDDDAGDGGDAGQEVWLSWHMKFCRWVGWHIFIGPGLA